MPVDSSAEQHSGYVINWQNSQSSISVPKSDCLMQSIESLEITEIIYRTVLMNNLEPKSSIQKLMII